MIYGYRCIYFPNKGTPFVKEYNSIWDVTTEQLQIKFTGIQLITPLAPNRDLFGDYVVEGNDIKGEIEYLKLIKEISFDIDMQNLLDNPEEV